MSCIYWGKRHILILLELLIF